MQAKKHLDPKESWEFRSYFYEQPKSMEWYRECSWPKHSPRLPKNRVDPAHDFVLHAERFSRAMTSAGNWNADKIDGCPFSSKSHTNLEFFRYSEKSAPESLKSNPKQSPLQYLDYTDDFSSSVLFSAFQWMVWKFFLILEQRCCSGSVACALLS